CPQLWGRLVYRASPNFFNIHPFRIIDLAGNSFQIFEFKGVIRKIFRNKELLVGLTRRISAGGAWQLTASTSCCQRAPTSGAGAASRSVLVTGTARPCYRSISIVADGRLEVCDARTSRL